MLIPYCSCAPGQQLSRAQAEAMIGLQGDQAYALLCRAAGDAAPEG
jgi:hypothetical protein